MVKVISGAKKKTKTKTTKKQKSSEAPSQKDYEDMELMEIPDQLMEALLKKMQAKGHGKGDPGGVRFNSILISGRIDEETSREVIRALLNLEKMDPTSEIILYINSYGGYVDDAMGIYDAMKFIKNEITTVCIGKAMSAGAFLLAAGKPGRRYCTPNSRIMIHKIQGGAMGNADDVDVEASEIRRLNEKFLGLLAKNCGMTLAQLKDKLIKTREIYLDGKTAKKFGIIDHIAMKRPKVLQD